MKRLPHSSREVTPYIPPGVPGPYGTPVIRAPKTKGPRMIKGAVKSTKLLKAPSIPKYSAQNPRWGRAIKGAGWAGAAITALSIAKMGYDAYKGSKQPKMGSGGGGGGIQYPPAPSIHPDRMQEMRNRPSVPTPAPAPTPKATPTPAPKKKMKKKKKTSLSSAVARKGGGGGKGMSGSPWMYAAGGAVATLALQRVLGMGGSETKNYNYRYAYPRGF